MLRCSLDYTKQLQDLQIRCAKILLMHRELLPISPLEHTGERKGVPPKPNHMALLGELHARDFCDTPEDRRGFLRQLTYAGFKDFILQANDACDYTKKKEPGFGLVDVLIFNTDQIPVQIDYAPPRKELKDDMLKNVFEAAQRIDDLESAATLLALGINIVHPFTDGNGRTSRFIYSLFTRGYDGSAEAEAYYATLLKNTLGRSYAHLNQDQAGLREKFAQHKMGELLGPDSTASYGLEKFRNQFSQVGIDNDVLPSAGIINTRLSEPHFNIPYILEWAKDSGRDIEDFGYYAMGFKHQKVISAYNILIDLHAADVGILESIDDTNKRQYMETLTDCFATGDSPIYGSAEEIVAVYRNTDQLRQIAKGTIWAANRD